MTKSNREDFYTWFVGFSEGDGSLFNTKKGKDIRFEIWQSRADIKVLEYIQSELGFGKIIIPAHRPDMAIYIVSRDEDLAELARIFSGRLCTNRGNSRFNSIFEKNNIKTTPTLNNAYLSGLIDAEGCFWIKQEAKTNTFKFIFEISQKDKSLLIEIREMFSFSSKSSTNNIYTDGSSWKLCFYSTKVIEELIAYLTKHELRSHKKEVYKNWRKGLQIKDTKSPDKVEQLLEIKQNLNKWRCQGS